MKVRYLFLFVFTALTFGSCNQNPELVSKWKLIEQLADPGDGSGVFMPVTSNKTIEFFEDGTISSNGDLCLMSTESGNGSSGTYSETDHVVTPDDCGNYGFSITYELDSTNLILNYPCDEPCREKYESVD